MTDENRRQLLNSFLRTIDTISDIEYQERVWIRGEGPEVDDFGETVCHFFDDGDPIFEYYEAYGISKNQYKLLLKFRDAFRFFSDKNYHPFEFINTPEWEKIISMAKELLREFNYQKDSEYFSK